MISMFFSDVGAMLRGAAPSRENAGWPAVLLLLASCACIPGTAGAAEAPAVAEVPVAVAPETDNLPHVRSRVGDATAGLLAMQRSGVAASIVQRRIPGDVAGRTYQRYLKSFEHPIPERSNASVGGNSSGGAR